ncbi:MAG: NAD(P)/FAD-dependent oxidoreductase [Aquabacterium sp.]|uniref:NAD(P)/FAD-dependent oxidoreductase n=1 Tax=Aquabacterium sp. TaxID=1872578 RepID=UPI0025C6823D|nr:NAD(P)/FAD-dependent oxidoreductase [Aquabacterium sp.]MBI5924168.1 NAD(P)/FAD-dependent oxidoreductase [Aquabacterium sp.]
MIHTDALVIGAGPVGLFQVFQLGLLGLKAEIIDVLPQAGGQCIALYPDKPIYDIPGVPLCTGRELTQQLLVQAMPFMPADAPDAPPRNLHLGHMVSELRACADGGFEIKTDKGLQIQARAVFIAAGAGAFVPRTLNLPGLSEAGNVHHFLHEASGTAAPWAGQHLIIHGGGDEALSAVLSIARHPNLTQRPARLSLLHRRDQFQAETDLDAAVRELMAVGQIDLIVGMPTETTMEDGQIKALQILGADGQTRSQPLDHLLIRLGMSPKLGPLSNWGMALERKQVAVNTASFESSIPRLYAVGDINVYPGKKRLLLCGFHEATLAAHHAAAALNPDAPQHLLYTTTSPLLHQRLGIAK